MKRAFLCFAIAVLVGCWKPHPPEPPEPEPGEGPATCDGACDRARELECPWAADTPEGGTCEDVCRNIEESGITRWNLVCRVEATNCARMDLCEDS
jgi:hypothetical protein